MLKKTSSAVHGVVNHLDRKLGAINGKLVGLNSNQIRSVGLWDCSTLARHYDKLPEPDIAAKLSGFNSSREYYIGREKACIDQFCQQNKGCEKFFTCFFPFLDDKQVEKGVQELQFSGNNTAHHVFKTLRYLRAVFFRDIVLLKDSFPDLEVFSSTPFVQFPEVFDKWCNYVKNFESSYDFPQSSNYQDPINEEWKDKIESKTAQVAAQCSSNARKLDRIVSLLEGRSKPDNVELPKETSHEVCTSEQGLPMLTRMRPFKGKCKCKLNANDARYWQSFLERSFVCSLDMSLRDVFQEYMYGFEVSGIHYPPLKKLEARRVHDGDQYRDASLRTIIGKRMFISSYLEEQSALLGDLEDSFKAAEELQKKIGKKRPCSLHQFWLHLKKKQKTE